MMRLALLALALSAALAPGSAVAAESETASALRALQGIDDRVAQIGYRLAVANADLCPVTLPLGGFSVHHLGQYAPAVRADAAAAFGLADWPVVLTVATEGAAARAGLRPGDAIETLDGIDARSFFRASDSRTAASFAGVQAFESAFESAIAKGPVTVRYTRAGISAETRVTGEKGCASRVQVLPATNLKASANGTYVQITSALVQFVPDDDELALVIAHEMAHNVLGHRATLDAKGVPSGIMRQLGVKSGAVRETEIEADYYGLYLMARAGYDVGKAPAFWRRYANRVGLGIFSSPTHPSWKYRIRTAERVAAEIADQRARGVAIVPQPQSKDAAAQ